MTGTASFTTISTPIGPFTLLATEEAVLASGWTASVDDLVPLVAPALRPVAVTGRADLGAFSQAAEAYHAGALDALDAVPVRQVSGPFLTHAWDVLRTVPAGAPLTYAGYAAKSGRPGAVRAAANACARNAAALFVPCHRIVRTGGGLGGFRWGLEVKQWLLDHEAGRAA